MPSKTSVDLLAVLQAMHGKASDLSTALKGLFGGSTVIEAVNQEDIGGGLPLYSEPVAREDDLGKVIRLMNKKRGREI
jgi:hypothetical protein